MTLRLHIAVRAGQNINLLDSQMPHAPAHDTEGEEVFAFASRHGGLHYFESR